jgi:hypothetical protein
MGCGAGLRLNVPPDHRIGFKSMEFSDSMLDIRKLLPSFCQFCP